MHWFRFPRLGYYISGNYVGLSLYEIKDGKLVFRNNISGYGDLVQELCI